MNAPDERCLRRFIDAEGYRADETADDVAVAGCIKRDADACRRRLDSLRFPWPPC